MKIGLFQILLILALLWASIYEIHCAVNNVQIVERAWHYHAGFAFVMLWFIFSILMESYEEGKKKRFKDKVDEVKKSLGGPLM